MGILRLAAIALIIVATWYVTRLPQFTLREVVVEGGETISHDVVRARITEELSGEYFLIIPKKFTYLYPHDAIIRALEQLPRIHDVAISRSSRNAISATFEEYSPHALWCLLGGGDAPCWFIDSAGFAFAVAPPLEGGTFVRHVYEGDDDIVMGSVISEVELAALDAFMQRAHDELGFRITSLIHKKDGDVTFSVNGGGEIFASKPKDFQATFENLKSVLTSSEFKHIAPGNFKYIDVRFENKVFVNEEFETENTTGTTTGSSTILSE